MRDVFLPCQRGGAWAHFHVMTAPPKKNKSTKFAATLSELERALEAWDEAVTLQPSVAAAAPAPLYETKLIKELCKQLRELSKG